MVSDIKSFGFDCTNRMTHSSIGVWGNHFIGRVNPYVSCQPEIYHEPLDISGEDQRQRSNATYKGVHPMVLNGVVNMF